MFRRSLVSVALFCNTFGWSYRWPSPQYEGLEMALYEGNVLDGSNLANRVNGCNSGRAALTTRNMPSEWIRFAFHDAATYDASKGTGGLDASLLYELDRPENQGTGLEMTVEDYYEFATKYTSRADVIALGLIWSVAACDGPIIPFRGGRMDATAAGPPGVPEPHGDLATHTEQFRKQGFTQEEMIALVACGHAVGGVRSNDFPDMVPAPTKPGVESNVIGFDSTMTKFDTNVVTEYLDGTTMNPLVVDKNETLRSDLRIFNSDNNATMHKLAALDTFRSTCKDVFEKLLNNVPRGIKLTEEIKIIEAKVSQSFITVVDGKLVFRTHLRLAVKTGEVVPDISAVRLFWCDRYGPAANCKNGTMNTAAATSNFAALTSPVTVKLGMTLPRYHFMAPIEASRSISYYWFQVDGQNGKSILYFNEGDLYKLFQDTVIYALNAGSQVFGEVNGVHAFRSRFVAGVRNEQKPSRVYARVYANTEQGAPPRGPVLDTEVELLPDPNVLTVEGYSFYSAELVHVPPKPTIDLHAVVDGVTYSEDFLQTVPLERGRYKVPLSTPTTAAIMSSIRVPL